MSETWCKNCIESALRLERALQEQIAELAAAKAENERLRTALRQIIDAPDLDQLVNAVGDARRALSGEGE